MNTEYKLLF